jgi:hypothetical protein
MSMYNAQTHAEEVVLQVAVWGQAIGFLSKATAFAVEGAPDVFAHVGILNLLLPVAAIGAMYSPNWTSSSPEPRRGVSLRSSSCRSRP